MGKLAVENAFMLLEGNKIPDHIYSKTRLITKDSLELPFQYRDNNQ